MAYDGTSVPLLTTAPAPTRAPECTTTSCRTIEPDPIRQRSSIVQPSRWAMCPMTQSSPMRVALSAVACTTVPSWTDVRSPTTIVP